ncbi:MAG: hypothetical protein ABI175_15970, partial [Polyangiales bacterium]
MLHFISMFAAFGCAAGCTPIPDDYPFPDDTAVDGAAEDVAMGLDAKDASVADSRAGDALDAGATGDAAETTDAFDALAFDTSDAVVPLDAPCEVGAVT